MCGQEVCKKCGKPTGEEQDCWRIKQRRIVYCYIRFTYATPECDQCAKERREFEEAARLAVAGEDEPTAFKIIVPWRPW